MNECATMTVSCVSDSVVRTAGDALMAKRSAIAAGYQPLPENGEIYRECLSHLSEGDLQRQSPLVNAGYAMRIASVAQVVHSFVSFFTSSPAEVNIVLLGCGMDALGIWASTLGTAVRIWEVDTTSVVTEKAQKLERTGLVQVEKGEAYYEGRIRGLDAGNGSNYHLFAADLRDLKSLDGTLGHAFAASQYRDGPTLVVFELVLAYLEAAATNNLLQWCASNLLGQSQGSALVAFEPLGPSPSNPNDGFQIVSAYQQEYARQFRAKLQKGRAPQPGDGDVFCPLVSSCGHVERRLSQAIASNGVSVFPKVHACLAGTAAHWAERRQPNVRLTLPPGELFDEHAALILHLSSYALVVAFPSQAIHTHASFLLRQTLCPWHPSHVWTRPLSATGDHRYVTPIEPEDEAGLREIFTTTYEPLSAAHAAVKRMVQMALQKELASSSGEGESAIRGAYRQWEGEFFVAVRYDPGPGGVRRVLGGIGVRKWKTDTEVTGKSVPGSLPVVPTYEIHRFFLDVGHRRKGIGTAMLQMAESWVHSQVKRSSWGYRMVATTLVVLEEANHFYTKHGYRLDKEASIGQLQMRTYARDFSGLVSGQ